ncbi:hypothetical protein COB55_05740 [Candidatus Wolfebacteria bacterium]|nr:MAG: hypothetical protein COB55_05740 [Candidatus Wolfebacteria bacterium]
MKIRLLLNGDQIENIIQCVVLDEYDVHNTVFSHIIDFAFANNAYCVRKNGGTLMYCIEFPNDTKHLLSTNEIFREIQILRRNERTRARMSEYFEAHS